MNSSSRDPTWSVRRRYFPAVEGMRGVAALLVIAGHLLEWGYAEGSTPYELGYWLAPFGLVVFFAISGFLLYRPFLAARSKGETVGEFTPSYLWRRAVRILPAYWVALTLSTIWMSWPGVFSGDWWVYYGLFQTYSADWYLNGLPTAWSLGVEITFYLLLPLIALALARYGLGSGRRNALRWEVGALVAIGVASLLWRAVLGTDQAENRIDQNLLGCLGFFSVGMLFAAAEVTHPRALQRLRGVLSPMLPCWLAGAVLFALIPLEVGEKLGLPSHLVLGLNTVLYGLSGGLLLGPAIFGDGRGWVQRLLENRVAVFAGTISYGLYLWHWPFVAWAASKGWLLDLPASFFWLCLVTIVGTTVAAIGSWYLVEKPLMLRARSVKAFQHRREGKVEVAVEGASTWVR
ncbi:MAG TPA: acyltransferase [Solirubrobacterales bacterium]|nr:acyltransferase [Solirubrobacterales bacterium]